MKIPRNLKIPRVLKGRLMSEVLFCSKNDKKYPGYHAKETKEHLSSVSVKVYPRQREYNS